jgi:hypothetical protein
MNGFKIELVFDTGTWRGNLDLRVRVFDPPVSVSPTYLFGVDLEDYLCYQRVTVFEEHLRTSLDLISRFVSGLELAVLSEKTAPPMS